MKKVKEILKNCDYTLVFMLACILCFIASFLFSSCILLIISSVLFWCTLASDTVISMIENR